MPELTGERPIEGATPDSLLALHAAGYRAVRERVGAGRLLDVGCGEGFDSTSFLDGSRNVLGVDYELGALRRAVERFGTAGFRCVQSDAARLGLATGTVDWLCSSHLVEHFDDPSHHVSEAARVLATTGTAFFLTPNETADFENPFHVHPFGPDGLTDLLGEHFRDVALLGLDGSPRVKQDFMQRRNRAQKILALDFLELRRRVPRSWYVGAYTRLLPLTYRLVARKDTGGTTGITADDFFVTESIDDTTLVLFAIARDPVRSQAGTAGTAS